MAVGLSIKPLRRMKMAISGIVFPMDFRPAGLGLNPSAMFKAKQCSFIIIEIISDIAFTTSLKSNRVGSHMWTPNKNIGVHFSFTVRMSNVKFYYS